LFLTALWRKHFVIEESLMEVEDTCIMPHPVLKASGHVDRFTDFMVKDLKDPSKFYRADKLLEDHMETMMAAKGVTPEQREEYEKVKNMADGYTKDELHAVITQYGVKSPETKNGLSEPYAFNLMFPTPIGPSGLLQGYLRPETAQGIFLNYPFCLEQNGGQMPFGVAQIGKAFRNEIAPRQGLLRQREFTQAEIEFFCKPGDKPHPKFASVAHLELSLFSSPQQLAAQQPKPRKLGEAVAEGLIANETLAYFIARTFLLSRRAGILGEHIRFRQHLPTEMAHYASDCWDMEVEMSYGWIECVGIADRSAFDLTSHAGATGKELSAREKLETPITEQAFVLSKKASAMIGKDFKAQAKAVSAALAALSSDALGALSALAQADGTAKLALDGGVEVSLTAVQLEGKVESKTVHERVYVPNVVEPSFGIDRLLTAIYEHSYYVR
jgi:glycyl-tRNA synthetase